MEGLDLSSYMAKAAQREAAIAQVVWSRINIVTQLMAVHWVACISKDSEFEEDPTNEAINKKLNYMLDNAYGVADMILRRGGMDFQERKSNDKGKK